MKLQRPRRATGVEFGGKIMMERVHYYMTLNPQPNPPIEVRILLGYFYRKI